MSSEYKTAADCHRFYTEYIEKRKSHIRSDEEYSFLLGYYAHLIADAEFLKFIRDEARISAAWQRIINHPALAEEASGMAGGWDSVKRLIGKDDRSKDIHAMEADYLARHPNSGYFTEILALDSFPDYIDYLPSGAIVRKIKIMGYVPSPEPGRYPYVAMSREEYDSFIDSALSLTARALKEHCTDFKCDQVLFM